jgi:NAD(P)-dependent dehydrogenase (short-subunit alcohol dehydrogenase family)
MTSSQAWWLDMGKSNILITGSSEGLGLMAARILVSEGHRVTLHARNSTRARDAARALPQASRVVIGDASTLAGMREIAEQANVEHYDAVIHNVAVGYREPRSETEDGIEHVFATNVLAPYVLTALMKRPRRLIYLSSGLHREGEPSLADPLWLSRPWNARQAYSDSKLYDVVLAFAIARLWPNVYSNALEPGWVATKMGGAGAPDDLSLAPVTQAWLAGSDDPAAKVTAGYFYHQRSSEVHESTRNTSLQDELLAFCAGISRVLLPEATVSAATAIDVSGAPM